MKALVYFQPSKKFDNFEGARMRKTIKGALEIINEHHTSSIYDDFDVAYFISPDDEFKIIDVKERNKLAILFALYSEDDEKARFLDFKDKDGIRTVSIKAKSLRCLNKADCVLVPSAHARTYLLNNGVNTKIDVCLPGVNLSRFDFSREDEKALFYRYFREEKDKRIVVAIGQYTNNMKGISALVNSAIRNPNVSFYFIGIEVTSAKLSVKVKKVMKNAPKNLHFRDIIPDDIYRSALLNADVFMYVGYTPIGISSLLEAMAAKCQIIVRQNDFLPEFIESGETAYVGEFSETLTSLCTEYLSGEIKPTIDKAYEVAAKHSLRVFGEDLINIYKGNKKEN